MTFNSIHFLIFFPVVCLLFFQLSKRNALTLLLLASCFFYAYFIPKYLLILFLLIGVDYSAALFIERAQGKTRKLFLWASLGSNILLLGAFKYFNFVSENLSSLLAGLGYGTSLPKADWVLPIGLSFHTFQSMSYTIEVYRGHIRAERSLAVYALYVLFFPQLVAGPIERPQNLLDQFRGLKPRFDASRVSSGLKLMLFGMAKKVVVADGLATYVSEVFDHPGKYGGMPVLMAMLFFSIQIFCDFSGYTDIARGSARVLGVELMENFRRPYLASSIADFWRRWHISLSTWFRDYVYLPLGGNRCSLPRQILNICIVFLLSGLWHGANWTFVIWGLLHAGFFSATLIAQTQIRIRRPQAVEARWNPWRHVAQVALTFSVVTITWVFFRASSLESAIQLFQQAVVPDGKMASFYSPVLQSQMDRLSFAMALVGAACLIFGQIYAERRKFTAGIEELLEKLHGRVRYPLYAVKTLAILNSGSVKSVPFIYFQF